MDCEDRRTWPSGSYLLIRDHALRIDFRRNLRAHIADADTGLKQLFNLTCRRFSIASRISSALKPAPPAPSRSSSPPRAKRVPRSSTIEMRVVFKFGTAAETNAERLRLDCGPNVWPPHFQHDRGARLLLLSAEELAARQNQ